MKVLIIIPAYNEGKNIENVVQQLVREYSQFDYVIVNDGSTDNTAEICRKHNYNYINLPVNLGLAGAFQAGMRYAKYYNYDYAIQFDGDGQHNPKYIESMVEHAEKNNLDVVIGSRFLNGKKGVGLRMMGNSLIQICIFLVTGKNIKDPTSGMRLFHKRVIWRLAVNPNYGPEPDTIAYLIRCGVKVQEYPVKMEERVAGESYLTFSKSILYMINKCVSILILQWFRKKEK